jgi:hypothetical protein
MLRTTSRPRAHGLLLMVSIAFATLIGTLSFAKPPSSAALASRPSLPTLKQIGANIEEAPVFAADFFRPERSVDNAASVRDFGAVGDGVADDTAAINAALNDGRLDENGEMNQPSPDDYNGRTRLVYFPPGTYRVSGTLRWVGCCLTMRGAGPGRTTIRLDDDASGFGNPAAPRAVVETQSGNESFRQYVMDLTVDTGRGNDGAIGVNYISSNMGALRNVRIRSGDGAGHAGIGMDRSWTGPALVKDVEVRGFDHGVVIGPGEYGPVFEGLTLSGYRVAGIRSSTGAPSIRSLHAIGSGPAFLGTVQPNFVALIDAVLVRQGGRVRSLPGRAIQSVGDVSLRNVVTRGFAQAAEVRGVVLPAGRIGEYASTRFKPVGAQPAAALGLPVQETPQVRGGDASRWLRFPDGADYGNLRQLQSYLDAMAANGQTTLYFPFDIYFSYNEVAVRVPAGVERIIGYSSTINSDSRGTNGGGLRLIVEAPSARPLIVEQFGYGVKIDHRGPRTVVIKHGNYRYVDAAGSGDVFLEDVGGPPIVLAHPKRLWARQLNIETIGSRTTKLDNRAADAWVLGFKTEGGGGIFKVSGNARTELVGGFMLPNVREAEIPAFECDASAGNAQMALSYRYEAYGAGGVDRRHEVQYRERRNGQTVDLRTDVDLPRRIGMLRCG